MRQAAARRGGMVWGAAFAGTALAHYLPSTAILATWMAQPPEALPLGWCRWRGPAGERRVALTFDDGPSPTTTERTLDLLDQYGLRATFFVIGELAEAHPDLVREMRRRGHAVGSHGQRHEHHLLRWPSWIRADTARSVAVLGDVLGEPTRWYRPPFGQLTARTILEARPPRHGGCAVDPLGQGVQRARRAARRRPAHHGHDAGHDLAAP